MFWRKKHHRSESDLIVHETENRRESYRVEPDANDPIYIKIENRYVPLINIGALGAAFRHTELNKGDVQAAAFTLPNARHPITLTLEVVAVDADHICRCRFIDISDDAINAVHKYMLEMQKAAIRRKRWRITL